MTMQPLTTEPQLHARIAAGPLLVLYGGAHCGVCQAIRPRLEALVAQHFAAVALAYVDCAQAPALCAQQGVFSLPVLRFYVQAEAARPLQRQLALHEVAAQMERVLALAGDTTAPAQL